MTTRLSASEPRYRRPGLSSRMATSPGCASAETDTRLMGALGPLARRPGAEPRNPSGRASDGRVELPGFHRLPWQAGNRSQPRLAAQCRKPLPFVHRAAGRRSGRRRAVDEWCNYDPCSPTTSIKPPGLPTRSRSNFPNGARDRATAPSFERAAASLVALVGRPEGDP